MCKHDKYIDKFTLNVIVNQSVTEYDTLLFHIIKKSVIIIFVIQKKIPSAGRNQCS